MTLVAMEFRWTCQPLSGCRPPSLIVIGITDSDQLIFWYRNCTRKPSLWRTIFREIYTYEPKGEKNYETQANNVNNACSNNIYFLYEYISCIYQIKMLAYGASAVNPCRFWCDPLWTPVQLWYVKHFDVTLIYTSLEPFTVDERF